jgi:hypothetical protein
MQIDKNDLLLTELLNSAIKDFEKVEDASTTMNFVARRIGNIVKHMKDLRDDLRPRGAGNGQRHDTTGEEKPYRIQA